MKFRLTCKEAHRLVSEGLDRDLGIVERVRIRMHLTVCDACTNFNGQMILLRQAMHKLTVSEDHLDSREP
jgi:predicted anti-sigma-YlaC factor YlaD